MIKDTFNRDNMSFTGMQWFIWSAYAVLMSFRVPYLKDSGYSEVEIGAMMSVLSLVGIAGPIFWGAVSDRVRTCRFLLAANLLAGGLSALLYPAAVKSFGLLLGVMIFGSLTIFSMSSVVDGWAMRLKGRGARVNYGVIRSAGSLTYAVTNIACGALFAANGLGLMFPLFAGFSAVAALMVFTVRDRPEPEQPPAEGIMAAIAAEPKPLHRNAAFLLFVLMATLLYLGQSPSMSFYPLLLQKAGGTNADLGLANGIMAFSEFPVMFLSALLLRKFKDTTLLLVSMAFYALRIFLFYSMDTVGGLVWSQLTNSLSFAIFLPTSVHFIVRVTPPRLKATALSVASSVYMGGGGFVGNLLGGILIDSIGLRPMFGVAAVLTAAVTLAFGLTLLLTRRSGVFGIPAIGGALR